MKISLPEPNNITTPYRPSRIKLTTLSRIRPDPTITWTRTCTPPKNLWTDPSLIPKKSSKNSPLRTLTSKRKEKKTTQLSTPKWPMLMKVSELWKNASPKSKPCWKEEPSDSPNCNPKKKLSREPKKPWRKWTPKNSPSPSLYLRSPPTPRRSTLPRSKKS